MRDKFRSTLHSSETPPEQLMQLFDFNRYNTDGKILQEEFEKIKTSDENSSTYDGTFPILTYDTPEWAKYSQ